MATGKLKVVDRGDNKHAIEYIPETTENWASDYFSVSGYFGDYGPHLFKAAPDLYGFADDARYCLSRVLNEIPMVDETDDIRASIQAVIDDAESVMSKARGE